MNEYQQKMTTPPQNAPHKWEQPDYVAKIQWESNQIDKPILPLEDKKFIQKVVRKFLYYEGEFDPTVLVALDILAVAQSKVTEHTKEAVD